MLHMLQQRQLLSLTVAAVLLAQAAAQSEQHSPSCTYSKKLATNKRVHED
jgi:hypothetical protein